MVEMLAAIVGLCLAFYGVVDLVGRLCCYILFTDCKVRETLVLVVGKTRAEYRVRRLAMWRWLYPISGFEVAVVTDDADTVRICEQVRLPSYTQKEWEKLCEIALQEE